MKKIYLILIVIALFLTIWTLVVKANPSYFALTKETSTATTSPAFLTQNSGASTYGYVATSTLVFDTFSANSNTKTDSLALLIQTQSSSTATTLKWRLEFSTGFPSNDCVTSPLSCDWYSESINNAASTASTTVEVRTFKEYSWVYTPSTVGARTNPGDIATKLMSVIAPTRYVRVVFYNDIGSSTVWAQFVPSKERTE